MEQSTEQLDLFSWQRTGPWTGCHDDDYYDDFDYDDCEEYGGGHNDDDDNDQLRRW